MKKGALAQLVSPEVCQDFDPAEAGQEFKDFSKEFVREYRDMESDEHLWVGSVTHVYLPMDQFN